MKKTGFFIIFFVFLLLGGILAIGADNSYNWVRAIPRILDLDILTVKNLTVTNFANFTVTDFNITGNMIVHGNLTVTEGTTTTNFSMSFGNGYPTIYMGTGSLSYYDVAGDTFHFNHGVYIDGGVNDFLDVGDKLIAHSYIRSDTSIYAPYVNATTDLSFGSGLCNQSGNCLTFAQLNMSNSSDFVRNNTRKDYDLLTSNISTTLLNASQAKVSQLQVTQFLNMSNANITLSNESRIYLGSSGNTIDRQSGLTLYPYFNASLYPGLSVGAIGAIPMVECSTGLPCDTTIQAISGFAVANGNFTGGATGLNFGVFNTLTIHTRMATSIGANLFGYGQYQSGANISSVSGLIVVPTESFYGGNTIINQSFGIYIRSSTSGFGHTLTMGNQTLLFVEKPLLATQNKQVVLEGNGEGTGIWFNGYSYQRLFSNGQNMIINSSFNSTSNISAISIIAGNATIRNLSTFRANIWNLTSNNITSIDENITGRSTIQKAVIYTLNSSNQTAINITVGGLLRVNTNANQSLYGIQITGQLKRLTGAGLWVATSSGMDNMDATGSSAIAGYLITAGIGWKRYNAAASSSQVSSAGLTFGTYNPLNDIECTTPSFRCNQSYAGAVIFGHGATQGYSYGTSVIGLLTMPLGNGDYPQPPTLSHDFNFNETYSIYAMATTNVSGVTYGIDNETVLRVGYPHIAANNYQVMLDNCSVGTGIWFNGYNKNTRLFSNCTQMVLNSSIEIDGNITLGNTVQANKVLCWRSDKQIGYCSDAPTAAGACTCNQLT